MQKGGLIETYKILNGFEGSDYRYIFKFGKVGNTKGHIWKLEKREHISKEKLFCYSSGQPLE